MLEAISFAMSDLHRDNVEFPLSAAQLGVFDAWRRPRELLEQSRTTPSWCPTMLAHGKVDLVQDITTDCSVVASLCAATARSERGYTDVTSNRLSCIVLWADCILDHHSQHISLRPESKATDDIDQRKVYPSITLQWLPSKRHHRRSSPRFPYITSIARHRSKQPWLAMACPC